MTIENDLKPLMDLAKESKESEREIFRLDDGYELLFHKVDINRVVPKEVTGYVIYDIDRWIKSYNKEIFPSISEIENDELKEYISNLKWVRSFLIPENISTVGKETTVKRNYSLLKPNKVLTHNQALFLLLGLNALELDNNNFLAKLRILNGIRPVYEEEPDYILEDILWDTPQNFELKSCAYFDNGLITSEHLIEFASEDNNFFSDNWKKNKHLKDANDVSKQPRNKTEATINQEALIDELHDKCRLKNPSYLKKEIAYWVKTQLKERHGITHLTEAAIIRWYLK